MLKNLPEMEHSILLMFASKKPFYPKKGNIVDINDRPFFLSV